MKKVLLSIALTSLLCANEIIELDASKNNNTENTQFTLNIDYLKTLEKGKKRDFFINEYLKSDIDDTQALEALTLIYDINDELFYNFAKKFNHDETLAVAQCMNMEALQLINSYPDCIVNGLKIKEASHLTSVQLNKISEVTSEKYPLFSKEIKVLSSAIPFTKLIIQNKDTFYNIFLGVNNNFRENYFNYKLPKRTFQRIYNDKINFEKFLKILVFNPKLNLLDNSIKDLDDENLDANSTFYLAINEIRLKDYNKAYEYLQNAKQKAKDEDLINKLDFWIFLITKDKSVLEELALNKTFDFYTYHANEILRNSLNKDFSIFQSDQFNSELKNSDTDKKALLYSLAKVKSDFNNELVSNNLKGGIFQLETKQLEKNSIDYSVENFFTIKDNLNYMNSYLDSLKIEDNNPLVKLMLIDNKKIDLENIKKIDVEELIKPYFVFEAINLDKKENFLLWYTIYYNNFSKKEKIKSQTILETL